MPSTIRSLPTRTVWGPLAIAQHPSLRSDGSAGLKERLGIVATSQISKRTTNKHALIVAQNSHTGRFLDKQEVPNVIEPNIVVEPREKRQPHDQKITFSGHLIERKRPWVCLKVIQNPLLRSYRLHFVGDGPLRSALQSYVRQERLDAQVTFEGRLTRDDALESVATSTLLLLPSSREGAPWVVGEAAAMGVPSLVSDISGAGTVVELSGKMGTSIGEVENPDVLAGRFAQAAIEVAQHPDWTPTSRWSASRMPSLLDEWWNVESH
ncbi:glycosyltransferase [Rhodococcus sp. 077-4]|uniref:glycosyltransferase n=1 Tax=Rhodococcus sp. 077-4 TaxID=2789271 RepID=UPI0039F61A44